VLLLGGLAAGRGLAQEGKARSGDKDDLEKVRQELKQLQNELKALRERVKMLEAGGGGIGGPPFQPPFPGTKGLPLPPGMAKGKILKVDKEDKAKVVISLGKKDGVKVGQRLMAFRTKGRPQPVGLIKILEVRDKDSTGKLEAMPGQKGEVAAEVDDDVMTTGFGGRGPGPFPGGPGPFPGGPGPFPGGGKGAKGTVSKLDKDKQTLTLSVSGESPFKAGQMVLVVRAGGKPQPVGLYKITEANAKQLVCQLTKGFSGGQGGEVQVGDEVRVMPGPPTPPVPPGPPGRPGLDRDVPPPGTKEVRPPA